MQTLTQIKQLLDERGLRPKHALGQNFLIDQNLLRRLVDASGVGEGDLVVEVGPGTGTLTEELLARGCRVIACELDESLASMLDERLTPAHGDRLRIIVGDCLARKRAINADLAAALGSERFALVANLPYHAATPLVMTLLTGWPGCMSIAVTVQAEVAERLAASPADGKAYGQLSVVAQWLSEVERVATLSRECFWPRPDVTSAMVALRRRTQTEPGEADGVSHDDHPEIAQAVQTLFTQRRKRLGGVLKRMGVDEGVLAGEVDPDVRVESMAPVEAARVGWAVVQHGRERGAGGLRT